MKTTTDPANSFSRTLDVLLSNLANTGRGRKQVITALVDGTLAAVALWGAFSLRHSEWFVDFSATWHLFLLLPILTVAAFAGLGIYRWSVRSSNRRLFRQVLKGVAISALALILVSFLLPPDRVAPRSLFVIYAGLLAIGCCSTRALWQSQFELDNKGRPVAIYGAGANGQQLVVLLNSASQLRPVVFIDDNSELAGTQVAGLRVLDGCSADLRTDLQHRDIQDVVLAIPSLSRRSFEKKLAQFDDFGLSLKVMPSVQDIVAGTFAPGEVRDVSIEDILGRGEFLPDPVSLAKSVIARSVLVTGGGGSIGSELARQIVKLSPERLVILDNSEENLYEITEELRRLPEIAQIEFVPVLGSVRDRNRLDRLMDEHHINAVFHAAAYKHVPIIEAQPEEGVATNVFGTREVLNSAIAHGVSDFVLISTDKAVRPTNAMGATKRVAELVLQAAARDNHQTRISMVRFGNVLGSSGSVVPKFKRQILEGGPVTITHRDMTRYFMTIPEAAQLVLQASSIARGGDVFVLDMGEPVRIIDLARTMIRLFGKSLIDEDTPDGDIAIVEQGLRPGEKMYEELFVTDDHPKTSIDKVLTADEPWIAPYELKRGLERLEARLVSGDAAAIKAELLALISVASQVEKATMSSVAVVSKAANEHKVADQVSTYKR